MDFGKGRRWRIYCKVMLYNAIAACPKLEVIRVRLVSSPALLDMSSITNGSDLTHCIAATCPELRVLSLSGQTTCKWEFEDGDFSRLAYGCPQLQALFIKTGRTYIYGFDFHEVRRH